jgi:hypothetical protein
MTAARLATGAADMASPHAGVSTCRPSASASGCDPPAVLSPASVPAQRHNVGVVGPDGTLLTVASGPASTGGRSLAVGLQAAIDQRDGRIDKAIVQALLRANALHQLVRAFNVGRAIVERARG